MGRFTSSVKCFWRKICSFIGSWCTWPWETHSVDYSLSIMSGLECLPLKTLDDLRNWTSHGLNNQMKRGSVCLQPKVHTDKSVPKTLACHDMRGGYIEDRFVQGVKEEKCYNFYHWDLIDTFVYFSHHFITIPPVTWINVAHRNGVKMMGTVITEWDDGYKRCDEFLASESAYKAVAEQLVKITEFYQFDGWLINIENKILPEKVQTLCDFVKYLTERLHEQIPGSEVIWYDSVISTGELKWQDQLNEKNSMFFDVCDGIFLNYNWTSEKLQNSKTIASTKGRPLDVYVGIDVFGRGCPGGGGYNSIEALSAIRQLNMSAAIFAFGWVYETQGVENFIDNENRFWDLLCEQCPSSVWTGKVLSSSFCVGAGRNFSINGKVCNDEPWYNLSDQDVRPYLRRKQIVSHRELSTFEPCFDCAFLGGACLSYSGQLPSDNVPLLLKLFDLNIEVTESYIVSYSFKSTDETRVFMEMEGNRTNEMCRFIFTDQSNQSIENTQDVIITPEPVQKLLEPVISQICLPDESSDWTTRWYTFDGTGVTLTSLLFGISSRSNESQTVHLGNVQVFPKSQLHVPSMSNFTITTLDDGEVCLLWQCSDPSEVKYYIIHTVDGPEIRYLGKSAVPCYVITDCSLIGQKAVMFGIQAVLKIGLVTTVYQSEGLSLDFSKDSKGSS